MGASRKFILGLIASVAVVDVTGCGSAGGKETFGAQDDDASTIVAIDDGGTTGTKQFGQPTPDASMTMTTTDGGCASCTDATVAICGDGVLEPGEQCDDGNAKPGDGCSGVCTIEAGYSCPNVNAACVFTLTQVCGDGTLEGDESCDDGNTKDGDGCSSQCVVEAGYSCATPGSACTATQAAAVCGDKKVEFGEQCDDGNTVASDGCSPTCQLEQGYTCPTPGSACMVLEYCGDGVVQTDNGEACDDGNTKPGDGCSGVCQVEPGYACPAAGQACVKTWVCGNGHVDPGEACDDSNTAGGDGCSADCTTVEAGYTCPNVMGSGGPCTKAPANTCGDGVVAGNELCDDGNTTSGDGCSSTCAVEAGYTCPTANQPCVPIAFCGNGIVDGKDQCDDGNNNSGDGCSATCKVEPGFACAPQGTPPKSSCHATTCGDNVEEGTEQCDDGNLIPYDGCSPTCTIEPTCKGGTCTAVCGDGLKFPQEECDDGNTTSGDGCSASCTLEKKTGWTCSDVTAAPAASLTIPILYRDMLYAGTTTPGTGHPDFQSPCCGNVAGLVQNQLGPDSEPIFASDGGGYLNSPTNFCWWYHEAGCTEGGTNPFDKLVYLDLNGQPTTLTLTQTSTNVYSFNNQKFYPLDGLGWNAGPSPQTDSDCDGSTGHNFSFTSELHYPFTYSASVAASSSPAVFNFTGDDDVWAFINGQLVVDLGGVHAATNGSVTLNTSEASTLSLTDGGMYSIDLFQAERHTCASTYALTLSGFTHVTTTCQTTCGDGIVAGNEVCDDGKNDGSYGGCMPGCLARGPYCGDATTSNGEQCDDGVENGATGDKCSATCTLLCGDGKLEAGEQCDLGAGNNVGGYGGCNQNCTKAPYCGDAIKNGNEQCDDGKNDGSYGTCTSTCTLAGYCGDGTLQMPPETCDQGAANSSSAYGMGLCSNRCTPAPYCGDKAVEGQFGEQCDDGVNSGLAGSCTTDCKAFVSLQSCGDGKIESPEQCDDGVDDGTAASKCDVHCRFKCGNGYKDPGEDCDNGVNDGSYGTCNPNCTLAGYCGDGIKNGTEICDNGSKNQALATAYGSGVCTTACTFAPYCGDGRVESQFGEQCDGTDSCTNQCTVNIPH